MLHLFINVDAYTERKSSSFNDPPGSIEPHLKKEWYPCLLQFFACRRP
jgi:hypothetical protein